MLRLTWQYPTQRRPATAVDKDQSYLSKIDGGTSTNFVKMPLTKFFDRGVKRAIQSADKDCKVHNIPTRFWSDGITFASLQTAKSPVSRSKIKWFWIESPKQRSFTDTGFSKYTAFDSPRFFCCSSALMMVD